LPGIGGEERGLPFFHALHGLSAVKAQMRDGTVLAMRSEFSRRHEIFGLDVLARRGFDRDEFVRPLIFVVGRQNADAETSQRCSSFGYFP